MRVVLLLLVGCGSSSADAVADAAPTATSCDAAFRDACTRAAACGADGRARVSYGGGSAVDYESTTYCQGALPASKCGAAALQPPTDEPTCLATLSSAPCTTLGDAKRGLLLPTACR